MQSEQRIVRNATDHKKGFQKLCLEQGDQREGECERNRNEIAELLFSLLFFLGGGEGQGNDSCGWKR